MGLAASSSIREGMSYTELNKIMSEDAVGELRGKGRLDSFKLGEKTFIVAGEEKGADWKVSQIIFSEKLDANLEVHLTCCSRTTKVSMIGLTKIDKPEEVEKAWVWSATKKRYSPVKTKGVTCLKAEFIGEEVGHTDGC
jgi:hypothetical protein